eukprot:CAMPEP_0179089498 /NCGR_PEP_ID=MMETSP0796-20121207/40783_1 /TAXON_ID=73915 /ORGANISM="Pyrodinium bahamense, Strain pbaha01" /LENGTH=110 /DNA_ID=CAMNT_0020787055 /DNA_START=24 /DNA_END=354 /DNA_ORIENTATION=+
MTTAPAARKNGAGGARIAAAPAGPCQGPRRELPARCSARVPPAGAAAASALALEEVLVGQEAPEHCDVGVDARLRVLEHAEVLVAGAAAVEGLHHVDLALRELLDRLADV